MSQAMQLISRVTVGGLLAVAPLAAFAQGRIVRPSAPGPIGVTLPPPPAPRMEHRPWSDDQLRHGIGVGGTWSYPIVVGSSAYPPAPQPVPYPVPVYYPVRVREARPEPVVPAVPYNPATSRTVMIGAGTDGGAGVMAIERLPKDSLRVTWRGAARPVSEARFYLADAHHAPLASRLVTLNAPVARFARRGPARTAMFMGLAVTYGDGSMQTWLVPLDDDAR